MLFFKQKKQHKEISPGEFTVFCSVTEEKTHSTLPKKYKQGHLGFVLIFVMSLGMHSWAFVENYLLRQTIIPITLFISSVIPTTLFAQDKPAPEKEPEKPGSTPSPASPAPTAETASSPAQEKKKKKISDPNDEFDPLGLDETRVKILLSLSEREKEIQKQQDTITDRENMVKVLETQLSKKAEELIKLKKLVEEVANKHNDETEKNVQKLVGVYEAMKPQSAAVIFNDLPSATLMAIFKAMSPKKLSPIMTAMNVDKVRSITKRLANEPLIPEEEKKK